MVNTNYMLFRYSIQENLCLISKKISVCRIILEYNFNDKVKFEQIIKRNYEFNCTINSSDIKNNRVNHSIYPIKGQIGTMNYVINEKGAYIENSIHKYHNFKMIGKDINYNDFSYCDITQALDDLQSQIPEYDFTNTKITSLEFGFNLKLDRSVQAQNKLDYPLLRMEIKCNYKELKKKHLGIYTFSDLYNPKKIQLLFMDFIKRFEQLVIVDNRFTSNLSQNEIEYLGNQLEYTYWNKKFGSSSTKYRCKKKFREFIQNKNLTTTYNYLKQKIKDKYRQLFRDCEGVPIHISD